MHKTPRLKHVSKTNPPYPLNTFSKEFGYRLGEEIVYILATKNKPTIEGEEWEQIFAKCIGAEWKPSNVGLDDVVLENLAFSAKTVQNTHPSRAKKIRLISGRNSPGYSFGETDVSVMDPDEVGEQVLSIWNARVSEVRKRFTDLRTVVLLKGKNLEEVAVFEFETILYDPKLYTWGWNERDNLEGYERASQKHIFTWQPHGAQFTIIEDVPENLLIVRISQHRKANRETILKGVGFDRSWIDVVRREA